jgi:hypothetical protein
MRWTELLTEKEVVALLEADGIVYLLESRTTLRRATGLCGRCHDGDVLAGKVGDW